MRYVIIVAGGKGVRMGADIPKQFLLVDGKAVLQHTMEKFLAVDRHTHFFVVLPKNYYKWWREYCTRHKFTARQTIVLGGLSRFHSVKNAIEKISAHHSKLLLRHSEGTPSSSRGREESRVIVAIHDGVRPLVSTELLQRCLEEVDRHSEGSVMTEKSQIIGAVPVYKVADSLCRLDATTLEPLPRHSDGTPNSSKSPEESSIVIPRENIFAVQTPQVFRLDVLSAAYKLPYDETFTDDASVVRAYLAQQSEACGTIKYIPGERTNIKITTPEDLSLAEKLL